MVEGKLWRTGRNRRDLLDDVITKGANVTVKLIQNVGRCKTSVYLLHFLIKGKRK